MTTTPTVSAPVESAVPAVIDIAAIRLDLETKKQRLIQITTELKQEFFGIDAIIDKIIESIQTWYLLPTVVTRPIICNLWSLTGCGKTALVRSLVTKLDFSNRCVEVQMDGYTSSSSNQPTSICQILQSSSIEEASPGIIFLDEFQRFRTVDDKGSDVKLERYQDVWMLLSDGKFSSDYSFLAKIEQQLAEDDYWEDQRLANEAQEAAEKAAEEAKDKRKSKRGKKVDADDDDAIKADGKRRYKRKYVLYPYEAKVFKKLLRLKEPLTEIMTWDKERVRTMVREYVECNRNTAIDYTKCLIFVAGNIDEAFRMSGDVEDCDTSADIFYEHTKKIGPIEIKKALTNRFRPEQIARLGNNHIVYPSLNRDAYERIIRRACRVYADEAQRVCGIAFVISESVYQEIYDNSVYPTQGTRPVFTSIHKMFGSPLSDAILWGLEHGITRIGVDLNVAESSLVFTGCPTDKRESLKKLVKIDFDIRARRASRSEDFNALVAVHEAGHAIVYAELFKTVPMEIAINVASFTGGYNMFKDTNLSKDEVLKRIAVGMGGIVAEELLFGEDMRSTGCGSDVANATSLASQYVRIWAMGDYSSSVHEEGDGRLNDNRVHETSPAIGDLVAQEKRTAQTVILKHRDLLIDLSQELLKVKKMDAASALEFMKDRVNGLKALALNADVNGDYSGLLASSRSPLPERGAPFDEELLP